MVAVNGRNISFNLSGRLFDKSPIAFLDMNCTLQRKELLVDLFIGYAEHYFIDFKSNIVVLSYSMLLHDLTDLLNAFLDL